MNILQIITSLDSGGAENQLLSLLRAPGLREFNFGVVYLKGDGELMESFQDIGNVEVFDFLSNQPLLIQVYQLMKLVKLKKFDLIHAHLPRAEIVAALSSCGRKVYVSRHNTEQMWPGRSKMLSFILSRIVELRSSTIICISQSTFDYFLRSPETKDPKKLTIIPYGIHKLPSSESKKKILASNNDGLKFFSLSRFVPQKHLDEMISGFLIFAKMSNRRHELHLFGEGALRSYLEQVAGDALNNSIFLHNKTRNVENIYRTFDVFLLSSKYEGFGLVLLEALNFGVPIICSDIPTSREILGDDYPGLYVGGSASSLASKLSSCLDTNFLQKLIGIRDNTLNIYEINSSAILHADLYRSSD